VEGSIRHPNAGEGWEYAVTVSITNDRGVELSRQIVGVGAIPPGQQRNFTVAVEVFTPEAATEPEESATRR
jgi:hypothetical protein